MRVPSRSHMLPRPRPSLGATTCEPARRDALSGSPRTRRLHAFPELLWVTPLRAAGDQGLTPSCRAPIPLRGPELPGLTFQDLLELSKELLSSQSASGAREGPGATVTDEHRQAAQNSKPTQGLEAGSPKSRRGQGRTPSRGPGEGPSCLRGRGSGLLGWRHPHSLCLCPHGPSPVCLSPLFLCRHLSFHPTQSHLQRPYFW